MPGIEGARLVPCTAAPSGTTLRPRPTPTRRRNAAVRLVAGRRWRPIFDTTPLAGRAQTSHLVWSFLLSARAREHSADANGGGVPAYRAPLRGMQVERRIEGHRPPRGATWRAHRRHSTALLRRTRAQRGRGWWRRSGISRATAWNAGGMNGGPSAIGRDVRRARTGAQAPRRGASAAGHAWQRAAVAQHKNRGKKRLAPVSPMEQEPFGVCEECVLCKAMPGAAIITYHQQQPMMTSLGGNDRILIAVF